jgi:hypothetical protein
MPDQVEWSDVFGYRTAGSIPAAKAVQSIPASIPIDRHAGSTPAAGIFELIGV